MVEIARVTNHVAQLEVQFGTALRKKLIEIDKQKTYIKAFLPPPGLISALVEKAKRLPAVLEE